MIKIEHVSKSYKDKLVLRDVSLTVGDNEFIVIIGSSGCGKTTLLRILIGLETKDAGSIIKEGREISALKPSDRGMGIVFQNYALFPNMDVL